MYGCAKSDPPQFRGCYNEVLSKILHELDLPDPRFLTLGILVLLGLDITEELLDGRFANFGFWCRSLVRCTYS